MSSQWRWAAGLAAAAGLLGLAGLLRALQGVEPFADVWAWSAALAAAAALLAAWLGAWAVAAPAFGLSRRQGFNVALGGAAPWALALLWPWAQRARLPYPHDVPERALQILLAGALLAGLAAALLGLLRAMQRSRTWAALSPRSAALRLGGLAWVLYLCGALWTWRWLMTGDSPHYMRMAAAFALHGTADVGQVMDEHESRRFFPFRLGELECSALTSPHGRRVEEHRPLMPLLAAPGYRLLGFAGALWTMALVAAAATALLYRLLRHRGYGPQEALIGWALLAWGAPWLIYSQSLLSEVLGGTLSLLWLAAWEGLAPVALGWLAPALLPWVATRLIPAAVGGCAAWAWKERGRPVRALIPTALLMASTLLYLAFNYWATDKIGINVYFANPMDDLLVPKDILPHLFGMLIDQGWGILPWAPVLLLAVVGVSGWLRRRDPLAVAVLGWCLPYLGLMACFHFWFAGNAPNRYMVPVVPMLALAAVEGLLALRHLRWPWALLWLSWALAGVLQVLPWFCFPRLNGESWPLILVGNALGLRLTALFPSFIINSPQSYLWALGLVLVAVRLAWHPALTSRPPR